jgi:hypothetical protein
MAPLGVDLENLLAQHGLTPLAVLAALPLAWRRLRAAPTAGRGPLLLFGVLAAGSLLVGWARNRFGVYLSIAEALCTAFVAREVATRVAARWPARRAAGPVAGAALAALLVAPVLPTLPEASWASRTPGRYTDLAPMARLAGGLDMPPGREAVLTPWSHGHDLRWFSGRPVVSSPFGIDGGPGALEADAAFHRATDQQAAEAVLAARRVGLVVIFEPLDEMVSLKDFAPPGALELFRPGPDAWRIDEVRVLPPFRMAVAVRLWLWDGLWGEADGRLAPQRPAALDGFRLVAESASISIWGTVGVPMFKLFQPVAGALVAVAGAAPGGSVEARTNLRTNRGRAVEWSTRATADAAGVARFRLPYATGLNGAVEASPWRFSDPRGATGLPVTERAVLEGRALEVRLR